jgi:hypothetical protein
MHVERHFQEYFSYIMTGCNCTEDETGIPRENNGVWKTICKLSPTMILIAFFIFLFRRFFFIASII